MNAFSKCFVFVRVAANHRHAICKKIAEKFLSSMLLYLYLHVTLFRMHVSNTATEKDFDIAIQMPLEHVSSEAQENRNGREK